MEALVGSGSNAMTLTPPGRMGRGLKGEKTPMCAYVNKQITGPQQFL
jgi:hypothetical protein